MQPLLETSKLENGVRTRVLFPLSSTHTPGPPTMKRATHLAVHTFNNFRALLPVLSEWPHSQTGEVGSGGGGEVDDNHKSRYDRQGTRARNE